MEEAVRRRCSEGEKKKLFDIYSEKLNVILEKNNIINPNLKVEIIKMVFEAERIKNLSILTMEERDEFANKFLNTGGKKKKTKRRKKKTKRRKKKTKKRRKTRKKKRKKR